MADDTPTSARTIRCQGCGSSIQLSRLASTVACAHCGHKQTVDPALLAELTEYRDDVHGRLEQAELERLQTESWRRTTDAMSGRSKVVTHLLPIAMAFVFPLAVSLTFALLVAQGVIAQDKIHYLSFILPGCVVIGLGGYYAWYFTRYRRRGTAGPVLATAEVRCPRCGAPNRIGAGEVLESCRHCSAALIPDRAARERSVDAATEEHRRAQLEKYRAERRGYASLQRAGIGPIGTILFAGGSFLLMVGGGTIAFSYLMIVGEEPYSPAIFAMWGVTAALVIGMAVAISTIRRRRARVRVGASTLAESLGGSGLDGLAGTVRWLNSYWAGPIDPFEMMPGSYYGAGAMVLGGFPVLVDVNPKAASQQHRSWARILIACDVPSVAAEDQLPIGETDETRDLLQRIGAAGYEVRVSAAGLFARAGDDIVPGLVRPEQIAAVAAPIVDLVRLAAVLDARPTPPAAWSGAR